MSLVLVTVQPRPAGSSLWWYGDVMNRTRVKVGDRVSFQIGAQVLNARVVKDLGDIGVNRRQLVVVAVTAGEDEGGEVREFDMPAEELEIVEPAAA